jgi:hypothetical protein
MQEMDCKLSCREYLNDQFFSLNSNKFWEEFKTSVSFQVL